MEDWENDGMKEKENFTAAAQESRTRPDASDAVLTCKASTMFWSGLSTLARVPGELCYTSEGYGAAN